MYRIEAAVGPLKVRIVKQILEEEYDEAAVRAASEEIADQIQTSALTLSTAVGEVRDVLTDE